MHLSLTKSLYNEHILLINKVALFNTSWQCLRIRTKMT